MKNMHQFKICRSKKSIILINDQPAIFLLSYIESRAKNLYRTGSFLIPTLDARDAQHIVDTISSITPCPVFFWIFL
jgi:hypothetical protein